jgi:TolB-like protein
MSDSREDEFFADGITDDIITQLSKIAQLRVISRTAMLKYKQSVAGPKEIGAALGVSSVLEGSVRRTPGQVRITARLIDAQDDGLLWTENYDRPRADIFAIQSDLAQNIAAALKVKLLPEEKGRIEKKPTDNTEAYSLYLRGRHFFFLETKEDVLKSLSFFQQAIEQDSVFALAWSGLSAAYFLLDLNWGTRPQYRGESLSAVRRALTLDPALAEGYVALGLIQMAYDRDWKGAEASYERAIGLNPNHWNAHREYGELLLRKGRVDAAIVELKRAVELEPLSLHPLTLLGWAYLEAGEHRLAIERLQEAQDLSKGEYDITRTLLAWEYLREGSRERAREVFKKADTDEKIWFDAVSAEKEQTMAILKREYSNIRPAMNYHLACVYAHLGDKAQAVSLLEQYIVFRPMGFVNLRIDPYLKPLHDDPRFVALLEQYGLSD